jgi:AcrR family transcriptional regulator
MTDSSKPKRTYNSTRRQAQARQTRQQIADAAQTLFSQRGYAGATIESIAQEAGVASETVYAVFGSKRKILSHLLDISIRGDDAPIPMLERAEPQAIFQQNDQRQQFVMLARGIAAVTERVAPVLEIMNIAAKTEPDIADLSQQMLNERWQNMAVVIQHIADNGPLREGITITQATDIVWTLMSPEVFLLLTRDRGWSTDQYREWLTDSLIRLLLP